LDVAWTRRAGAFFFFFFLTISSEESAAAARFLLPFTAAAAATGGGEGDKARAASAFLFLVEALVARVLVPVLRKAGAGGSGAALFFLGGMTGYS